MNSRIIYADIKSLIHHERVNRGRLIEVRKLVRTQGVLQKPVIVDRESNVILDGHHRVRALCELGAKRVPVHYVRYQSASVKVYLRRKNLLMSLIKQAVIEIARSGGVLPPKTTRHILPHRREMKAVPLSALY